MLDNMAYYLRFNNNTYGFYKIKHDIISYANVKTHIQHPLQANCVWCHKADVVCIHNMIHVLFINIETRFIHSKILR